MAGRTKVADSELTRNDFATTSNNKDGRARPSSGQVLKAGKRKPSASKIIVRMIQEMDRIPPDQVDHQHCNFIPVSSANVNKSALEMSSRLIGHKHCPAAQHRIEMFHFFSCIVALWKTEVLDKEDIMTTVSLALSITVDYVKNILKGVHWVHTNIIRGLLDLGWRLEEATAVVARYAPRSPSGFRCIRHERMFHKPLIAKLHSIKTSACVAGTPWSVPIEMAGSEPGLSLEKICTVMGYITAPQAKVYSIIHLCTVVGHPTPIALLLAAGQRRNRWTSDGSMTQFSILELGLDPGIVEVLEDPNGVDSLLRRYEAVGLLEICQSSEPTLLSKVHSPAQVKPSHWRRTMIFACFFLTGCCEYNKNVRANSLRALPLFRELIERSIGFDEHAPTSIVVRALLQASKFADNEWKSRCINIAKTARPVDMTIEDRAYLAYRESFVMRSQGREDEAQLIIEDILEVLPACSPSKPLLNGIYGFLLHSIAWIYIAQRRFQKAIDICSSWTAGASLYEGRADQKLLTTRGIARKHRGKLDDAVCDLKAVLVASQEVSRARFYVLANLSDVYCEQKQLEDAYWILRPAAEQAGCYPSSMSLRDTYHRTLLLSLAEVCSFRGEFGDSNDILLRLKHHFEHGSCTAKNDQRRHVRAVLLLAQNQHQQASDSAAWLRTQKLWRETISLITKYQILDASGWDYAVTCLSLHHALSMTHYDEEGDTWLQEANDIFLSGSEDHFWMRSLPIYWVPYILKQELAISGDLRNRIVLCCGDVKKVGN